MAASGACAALTRVCGDGDLLSKGLLWGGKPALHFEGGCRVSNLELQSRSVSSCAQPNASASELCWIASTTIQIVANPGGSSDKACARGKITQNNQGVIAQ